MHGRLRNVDVIRGAAVLLMVFGHSIQYGQYGEPSRLFLAFNSALSAFRMPVLMMISGMMASSMRNRSLSELGDRCATLFWLYAIWMPINWLAFNELPIDHVVINAPAALSLEFFRPTTVMWFIWALTIISLTIPIAVRLPKYAFLSMLLLLSAASFKFNITPFSYQSIMRFSVFFYIGFIFKEKIIGLYLDRFSLRLLATMFGNIILIHLLSKMTDGWAGYEILKPVERLTICIAALYSVRLIENIETLTKPLQWVGRNTLPIYVTHMPIVCAFRTIFPHFGPVQNLMSPILLSIFGVILALIFHHLLNNSKTFWLYARPAWFTPQILRSLRTRFA